MAASFSAIRSLLWWGTCALTAAGLLCCGGETVGSLDVQVDLATLDGTPMSCETFGAERIEVALYARDDDPLPMDRIPRACAVSGAGRGLYALRVATGHYERVDVRFLSDGGNTLRMCTAEGSADAVLSVQDVTVRDPESTSLTVSVVANPGSCPAP